MAWRDQMQKGSFRGVSFRVLSQDTEGGRRVAKHEYPGRDDPWPEDMGRKGRTHSLELHIIGADYMSGRDAMLAALEKQGPAELTHPWLGKLNVQVETYRLRESTREGGMATFSVTFTEAGKRQFPASSADTASRVSLQADAARLASQQSFSDIFDVAGQPGFVSTEAVSVLQQATGRINALIQSIPGIPTEISGALADVTDLQGALSTLILQPASLGSRLDSLIAGASNIFSDPLPAMRVYQSLGLFGDPASAVAADKLPAVPATTPARQQQAANQGATVALVRQLALASEADAASKTTPAASSDAIAMRDDLADRLDAAATAATDDTTYLALTDLRAAVVTDLTERAATLPRIGHVTPPATLPALVLAHQAYGDATRDVDIVGRNHVRHPGFVPGGTPLEVLRA